MLAIEENIFASLQIQQVEAVLAERERASTGFGKSLLRSPVRRV